MGEGVTSASADATLTELPGAHEEQQEANRMVTSCQEISPRNDVLRIRILRQIFHLF